METVFENDNIKVVVNTSTDEIFVTNKGNVNTSDLKTTLRISHHRKGFDLTADSAIYQPKSFHGLGGFHISQ